MDRQKIARKLVRLARAVLGASRTAAHFIVGDYVTQNYPDSDNPDLNQSYAVVVEVQRGGGYKVVAIEPWRGKAFTTSTKNWTPQPVLISEHDVPSKLKAKIDAKAAPYLSGPYKDVRQSHPGL